MRPPRAAPHGGSRSSRACSCWLPAVSLYVLLPTLASVLASWRSLSHLDWPFAVLAVACEAASFVCLWELDRIGLGARARFPIACAQLAGNAAGRATAALTASTALQLATTAALPLLALPVIVGGASVSRGLASAAYLGIAVLLLLLAAGTAAFAADRPLELADRGIQWLLDATVRRDRHVVGLPQQLLADRDFIRTTLGGRWRGGRGSGGGEHGIRLSGVALRAQGGRSRPPTLAGPAGLHLRRAARAGAVTRGGLGLWRRGWSARSSSPVSRDRGRWPRRCCTGWRLLAADSRRRRRLSVFRRRYH